MGAQLNRTDTTDTNTPAPQRWVLYKAFEEDTPALLQVAINQFIIGLPAAYPTWSFDVINTEFNHYNTSGPPATHFIAYVQFYFEGKAVGATPQGVLSV